MVVGNLKKTLKKKKPRDLLKPVKACKTKGKSNHVQSESLPLQIEDEGPDFPRGGGSSLSRKEEEEIRAEVDAEFEAEQNEMRKRKGKVNRRNFVAEEDLGSLFGEGINGKLPKFANKITLKNVSPGMKLWGIVAEVNEKDLVVGLPGGLRGLVRVNEASDLVAENEIEESEGSFLSKAFHIGQLVSCIVVQVDDDKVEGKGKRKIWLSLRLSLLHKSLTFDGVQEGMVLTSFVKSIEDHGYVVHFGRPFFTGFLPRQSKDGGEVKMIAGQLVQGVVKSIDNTCRVVHLCSDPAVVSNCVTKDLKGISIEALVPGMMVNARVQANLENGIMLSFLTYFTGTVDIFHLQISLPTKSWKDDYNKNKKVNARILFIDPSTRAVGLTLNAHLIHNKAPPSHVNSGEIHENCRIVRVDRGLGLLLEIPSVPVPTPGYVTIFDVADEATTKLEKRFKEGNRVRVRVLGFRHLEGLAMGVLKASAFEGPVFTHSDVKPGMMVKAKVIVVDNFGAIVQFSSGVKALCPLPHMTEFEIAKPWKKFKVGAELVFRVLGCKSKRITVTHKRTLVKSKLAILSSYTDATEGLITHGWIAKIEEHGCFVRFYNGVQGFVPRSELGLEPGQEATSTYHVGQVVKCRVISAIPASRRISLSLIITPKRASVEDVIKLGGLVSGIYMQSTAKGMIVNLNAHGCLKGTIPNEHLADNLAQATLLKSILKPGYEFSQLLVLDIDGKNLILSAKHSLIESCRGIPEDVTKVQPHSVVHGYICNIIEAGCFVRFLGRLTGFSPKHKATDDRRTDICESFYVGQSVRSQVLNVDNETGRVTLSLKQSNCFSTNASLIQGYFLSEEKIADLRLLSSKCSDFKWVEKFNIGSVVEGVIHETTELGVVVRFEDHDCISGFISNHQIGEANLKVGSTVRAMVLDIDKANFHVDLSAKPELVSGVKLNSSTTLNSKKKRKRDASKILEVHQTVNAIVEIVKESYLVLSVPESEQVIGYASIVDYNTQKLPRRQFQNGQSVLATVETLPGPSTAGRLLLLLKSLSEVVETSSSKRARKSKYDVGSLVEGEITDIQHLEMRLRFGIGFHGRVHITEANGDDTAEGPFSKFKIGQRVAARIIEKVVQPEKRRKTYQWELSIKPAMLSGYCKKETRDVTDECNYLPGGSITGYVVKVDNEWVWLAVSRKVMAKLFLLDSSTEPTELLEFQNRFTIGKPVSAHILSVNKEKRLLQLILRPFSVISKSIVKNDSLKTDDSSSKNFNGNVNEGDIVGGRITKIHPGVDGLVVQIGHRLFGKVHFMELTDEWVENPISGFHEGQFVKCKVLGIGHSDKGILHVDLSLRGFSKNIQSHTSLEVNNNQNLIGKQVEKVEDLQPNMVVQGYVKNVMSKGCFVMLSRKVDAKVLLSNLSDGFIEHPEREFPVGKLVRGTILSVEPLSKRVEVTLRSETSSNASSSKSGAGDFSCIHVGDLISGKIRKVASYGLFIAIDKTNVVGLCHVSELSDDHIENIESMFKPGEKILAKILKVDVERHRVSLGMKKSYLEGDSSSDILLNQENADMTVEDGHIDENFLQQSALGHCIQETNNKYANDEYQVLWQVESRASVLPLEVSLDDVDGSDLDILESRTQDHVNETDEKIDKSNKRAKKKEKEERELEIMAAERRLLDKDIPRCADDFEKLVRSSPNSSLVWIKYMAYMLSLADIDNARSIAERALRTINIREENEKLNVWQAYFNLENEYGSPREEAVIKTFQRALQYCDPKKVHLALLATYERTEQHKLADELLDQMIKKFKHSCKIWLRRVENLLKQRKDGVQSIVKRSLICLPRHKHMKFISKTAILEFKCGVPDRGRSMFEEVLREYPKRTDLWSIYLDQESRLGDEEVIRALFERATSLSLPPKKMKFLFKKYLEFEKSHGDEQRVESVKKKAMEYVESALT